MSNSPVVSTCQGSVKGVLLPQPAGLSNAGKVNGYFGIPFAKPPLNDLRFQKPQKPEPWSGVRNCGKLPPNPPQDPGNLQRVADYSPFYNVVKNELLVTSEDCLYLNVFTPEPNACTDLPVIFVIPGGAFKVGGTVPYSGEVFCSIHRVVMVVANYRVGVLGFLGGEKDGAIPGNLGLLDQVAALQWVRDNIKNFGGDPHNVNICGESAGSSSVGLHLLSPLSRGLFHRAIGQSGVASLPLCFTENKSAMLRTLLDALKITETEPEQYLKKLRAIPADNLVQQYHKLFPASLGLTVDGEFLPDLPANLLKGGDLAKVPFMTGFNNTEGDGILALDYPPQYKIGLDEALGSIIVKGMLGAMVPVDKLDQALQLITDAYWTIYPADDQYRWSKLIGSIITDAFMGATTIQYAAAHSMVGNDTYMCLMTHQLRCNHDEQHNEGLLSKAPFCHADHGDDLIFTFGLPLSPRVAGKSWFTEEEIRLSQDWMSYIANFAKSGNPNTGESSHVTWPKFDPTSMGFLKMGDKIEASSQPLSAMLLKLWGQDFPALLQS